MATVNPYFVFNGNCAQAFDFYKSVFGGEFLVLSKFKDMPPMEGYELSESAKEKILHVSLPVSKETVLMGSDSNPMMGDVTMGQNLSISVNAESKEEAEKIFNGISEGGKITMPIGPTFWSPCFGMLVDQFGIIWMVSCDDK